MKTEFQSILESAIYNNSYTDYAPWAGSIGFRTANTYYRNEELPNVAADFLAAAKTDPSDTQAMFSSLFYYTDIGKIILSLNGKIIDENDVLIHFPAQLPIKTTLEAAVQKRKSTTEFTKKSISLERLGTLLKYGNGTASTASVALNTKDKVTLTYRTHPSAGGLYPIDLYVFPLNVVGLQKNIYFYDPKAHGLVSKTDDVTMGVFSSFTMPEKNILTSSAAIIFLVGKPWKSMRKYGPKGLKFMYIEAGTIAQNINLCASALGLGSLDCASFCDDDINRILNLDGCYETFFHAMIIGTI